MALKSEESGTWLSGVFVGRKLAEDLYGEDVASCRILVRRVGEDKSFAIRVGEVMGSNGTFQACRMNGEHVGVEKSVLSAAKLLASTDPSYCASVRASGAMKRA